MDKLPRALLGVVAAAVMLLFLGGIILAARYSLATPPTPDAMPAVATWVVSSINGILAANLGAILGLSAAAGGFRRAVSATEKLQWTAAAYYVVMIVVTVVIWGLAGFEEDGAKIVSVIPEVGRTGIGIVLAVFAAILGVQTGKVRIQG